MICLMPSKKLYKKRKSLVGFRDFVIVNSTTNAKIRDMPNVLSDIMTSADGMRTTTGLDALAFQMNSNMFDEGVTEKRRQSLLTSFFLNADFQSELMNICAYQVKHPEVNIYVALEDKAYEVYVDQYIERMNELIEAPEDVGTLIFTWNSANAMKKHLTKQLDKQIGGFDKDTWLKDRDNIYGDLFMDDLEDDDYDRYLDAVSIKAIIDNPESNREIRELFFRYAKYNKKQIKALGKFVKISAEQVK